METGLTVQSLGDAVKDKVRKAMMDAIPDEALSGLIKAEFDKFFIDTKHYHDTVPSPFKQMVKSEIESAMREKIKEKIRVLVADTADHCDNNGNWSLIGELVKEMAPAAMQGTMQYIAGQCIRALKQGSY